MNTENQSGKVGNINKVSIQMILKLNEIHVIGFSIEGFYLKANLQEAIIFFVTLVIIIVIYAYIVKSHV